MKHCRKIDIAFDVSGLNTATSAMTLKGKYTKHQKYSLALKKQRDYEASPSVLYIMGETDAERIRQQLPQELLALETPEIILLTVTPEVEAADTIFPPHVDKIRIACLNIYLNPHDERTIYYDYALGEMTEAESFIAKHLECWVLDTTVPHAVELKYPHVRQMVSASFVHTPYETVAEIMSRYADAKVRNPT